MGKTESKYIKEKLNHVSLYYLRFDLIEKKTCAIKKVTNFPVCF